MIFLRRLLSILFVAGGWAVVGVRTMLDLIGYATAPDDLPVFGQRINQVLDLILLAPWWLVWGFAFFATGILMWVSWPRSTAVSPTGPQQAENSDHIAELRKAIEKAIERPLGAPNMASAEWANETNSLVEERNRSSFLVLFDEPLRCAPSFCLLPPTIGRIGRVQSISRRGFSFTVEDYDAAFGLHFFADAYKERPERDPLEDALDGKWWGNRFIFNHRKILYCTSRENKFDKSLTIDARPCPADCLAEIVFSIHPQLSADLVLGHRVMVGSGFGFTKVDQDRAIHLKHGPTTWPDKKFELKIELIGWRRAC